jgi:hypothetical protein
MENLRWIDGKTLMQETGLSGFMVCQMVNAGVFTAYDAIPEEMKVNITHFMEDEAAESGVRGTVGETVAFNRASKIILKVVSPYSVYVEGSSFLERPGGYTADEIVALLVFDREDVNQYKKREARGHP